MELRVFYITYYLIVKGGNIDMVMASTKIERKAISAIQNIINEHPTMEHEINTNDKSISWDGYIILYKNENFSKENFEARVPIQVKGRIDRANKYLHRDEIQYHVKISDLKVYSTEKGVIYFIVFINDEMEEIFYSSLYPSKISGYLEKSYVKGNKNCINVKFYRLTDCKEMYNIVKQFNQEACTQGTSLNPLVIDRIKQEDFMNLKYISLFNIGVKCPEKILESLKKGDICLYGKFDGDKYERPLEYIENTFLFMNGTCSSDISIDEYVFYNKYKYMTNSNNEIELELSENLRIKECKGKIDFIFKPHSTFNEIDNDISFLKSLLNRKAFFINKKRYNLEKFINIDEFESKIEYYGTLCMLLKMIGLIDNIRFDSCSEKQMNQLYHLVYLKDLIHKKNDEFILERFEWQFGDAYYPILVYKNENEINMGSTVYTDKMNLVVSCEGSSEYFKMPLFLKNTVEILGNLYYYDWNNMRFQIEQTDINEYTSNELLNDALHLISVYDCCLKEEFLDLSIVILDKIVDFIDADIYLLNHIQIIKRKCKLNANQIDKIKKINSTDCRILFCKSVLLEDTEEADKYFSKFSKEQRDIFEKYPIYKLYIDERR